MPLREHDQAQHDVPPQTVPFTGLRQLALQCAAVIFVLTLCWPYFGLRNQPLPWPETALAIGIAALILASLSRQPWWWKIIHTVFAPLAWAVSTLPVDPGWFLLGFILLLLFYRGAVTGQIPLYLSNPATVAALARLTADSHGMRFLDLGAGIGSCIVPLHKALPGVHLTGIENAPASWLIGWLRTRGMSDCCWLMADLWEISLRDSDVVYAFLSPAPMAGLWNKAQREMRSGSLFISNSFAVPDIEASEIIELDDTRQTRLHCYRIP